MRYLAPAALLALLTPAFALQTIWVGIKQAPCGSGTVKGGRYDIWFSDSSVCAHGYVTGYPRFSTNLCEEEFTLMGHTGLQFTGCTPPSMGDLGLPTGVSDGGNPALTCAEVEDLPDESCPNDCGYTAPYHVQKKLYCS